MIRFAVYARWTEYSESYYGFTYRTGGKGVRKMKKRYEKPRIYMKLRKQNTFSENDADRVLPFMETEKNIPLFCVDDGNGEGCGAFGFKNVSESCLFVS